MVKPEESPHAARGPPPGQPPQPSGPPPEVYYRAAYPDRLGTILPPMNNFPYSPAHQIPGGPAVHMAPAYTDAAPGPPPPSHQPAQSLVFQDANAKTRMRVSKACDRCRSQKIKCSGTYPCSTCLKHRKECHYNASANPAVPLKPIGGPSLLQPPQQGPPLANSLSPVPLPPVGDGTGVESNGDSILPQKRPLELPSLPSTGDYVIAPVQTANRFEPFAQSLPVVEQPQKSYVSHLESRVHYLESLLANHTQEKFRPVEYDEPENPELFQLHTMASSKWRYCRRMQHILVGDLCGVLYKSLSEKSKKEVVVPRIQYFGWNMSGVHYLLSEKLPDLPEVELPQLTEFYVLYFFREINPLFAILHERVFREQVAAYERLDPDKGNSEAKLFTAMLCLVKALSIRFTEFSRKEGPRKSILRMEETLFKYAHRVVQILSFEWESFELIQLWVLITLFLRLTYRQTSAFNALGRAVTMVRGMGLAYRHSHDKLLTTPYELLKAKRVYWCVFTFDKMFGLLSGKTLGLHVADTDLDIPTLDFVKEAKDDWITLPAVVLIHVAKVADIILSARNTNLDFVKFQQVNKDLLVLHRWFDRNGFDDDRDLFNPGHDNEPISSLVKAEVKLMFYDLIMCVHGRLAYNFLGQRIVNPGLKLEMVIEGAQGIIKVMNKMNNAGLLYMPWHLHLLLTFDVGIFSLVLLSGGVYLLEAKNLISNSINIITLLTKSPIINEEGRVIMNERFKMAKECLWTLKTANHILSLKLRETFAELDSIGIDHGSPEVNRVNFQQFGRKGEFDTDRFSQMLQQQRHRELMKEERPDKSTFFGSLPDNILMDPQHYRSESASLLGVLSQPTEDENVKQLVGNLQWFDQWLDLTYDLT